MPSTEPQFDVSVVVPELRSIRAQAVAGDYAAVADALLDLSDADDALLPGAASVVAGTPGAEAFLDHQVRQDPGDFLARTLLAYRLVAQAWEARGGYQAHLVSDQQFEAFFALLRTAEGHLIRACAEDPTWHLPWLVRMMTARGLQLGLGETRRRYQRLTEHHPHQYEAQQQMLQMLCPKWSGTWEDAFGFARECAAEGPQGSPAGTLVARMHLERSVDMEARTGGSYLRQQDVLHELRVTASASVLHPGFRRTPAYVDGHTLYGALFAMAGEKDEAARHFRALGEVVDRDVWGYLGSSTGAVNRIRTKALAKG